MGLDMYLTKQYYVKNWDHFDEDRRWKVSATRGVDPRRVKNPERTFSIPSDKIEGITVGVAYWRKANQIHDWFVNNCQGGVDECQRTFVQVEQLQELLDLVTETLESKSEEKARDLLAPAEGFFFGSYDIDEYYWDDLKNTKKMLTEALKEYEEEAELGIYGDFYYQSSW
jgi:hypothetical protein